MLQRMRAVWAEAFDGGDLLAGRVVDGRDAGARRSAVEMNRAGAASADAATELRAAHAEDVA